MYTTMNPKMFRLCICGLLLLSVSCYKASEEQGPASGESGDSGDWFRVPRNPPVLDLAVAEEVNVREFGAVPDDDGNDWEAIRQAFEYLQERQGNVRLVFTPGKYLVTPTASSNRTHCFSLTGAQNFVVDFRQAELVIGDPTIGLLNLKSCRNGVVRHAVVDYDPLPFTQGTIESPNGGQGYLIYRIDAGFPELDADHLVQAPTCWATVKDPLNPQMLKAGTRNLIPFREVGGKRWEKLSDGTYRVNVVPNYYALQAGDPMVVIGRYNGRPTFTVTDCERVTFDGNTLYAGPAGGYGLKQSPETNIVNARILYRDGRLLSQNADCVHANASTIGPWIESCIFEGQCDDAVNLKTQMLKILQAVSADTYLLSDQPRLADVLRLFNPRDGALLGEARVLSAVSAPGGCLVKLDKSFSGLQIGETADCDMFFNDYCSNESFVIRNNIFRNSRRYGVLIQATHGKIENNEFRGLSSSGIVLQNNASWPEGFVPYNVRISGNLIRDCGFEYTYVNEALSPIMIRTNTYIEATAAGYEPPVWKGVCHIVVDNNIVRTDSESGITASDVDDIRFESNQIECSGSDPVVTERCEHVVLE